MLSTNTFNMNVVHTTDVSNLKSLTNSKSNLNIIYINIQSLRNKLYDLETLIYSYDYDIHIVVLTEIWLRKNENNLFNISGYVPYFSNRQESFGGVAIYIKGNINSSFVMEEEFNKTNILITKLSSHNINIIGIYRSHETRVTDFIHKLDNITSVYKNSIILGDMNLNLLNTNQEQVILYTNTLLCNGYLIYNKISSEYATRISRSTRTVIDHLVSDLVNYKYNFVITGTSLSDHEMFLINISLEPILENKSEIKTVLDYDKVKLDKFWTNLDSYDEIDSFVTDLNHIIVKNTKAITVKKSRYKNKWMTKEILDKIKLRDSYYKYSRKYNENIRILDLYKKTRLEVSKMILQAKKDYFSKDLNSGTINSKRLWNFYKKIIHNTESTGTNKTIKSLVLNNEIVSSDSEIANKMNSYFVNVTDEINISPIPIDSAFLNSFRRNIFTRFSLQITTQEEVKQAILNLNPAAATGHDNISTKFLQKFSSELTPTITRLINIAIQNSVFPQNLKIAIVTPIYKAGAATDPSNYRPISVLNALSKVFEIIIKRRLNHFLSHNSILHEEQFGFESNSNTTAACLSLTHFISNNIDSNKFVACIFLDLQKAFDCVDHEILLCKMANLDFPQNAIQFFKSYLSERVQKVKIGNSYSDNLTIKKGVPQGSILGPDLFKIYIDDIARLNLKGSIQLYADDAVIKYSTNTENELRINIENDLKILDVWITKHKLSINIKKTKILLLGNKLYNVDKFYFKSKAIETVNNFNYLGLVIDKKLKWTEHIQHVISKISPMLFLLRRLRKFITTDALYTIYSSYVMSHIVYLNPIWSGASQQMLGQLDVINKKAIKIIHNYPLLYPTNLLYTGKYLSFKNICKRELYLTAYKIINNKLKHNFVLNRMIDIHTHNTRNKTNFYLSLFKTNQQNNNCLYKSLKLYNELPSELKEIESIVFFKKEIKRVILNNC